MTRAHLPRLSGAIATRTAKRSEVHGPSGTARRGAGDAAALFVTGPAEQLLTVVLREPGARHTPPSSVV
ncbi:hypothetical protein T261_8234 [Streptomyces lydicus]|nr:hypothetical protein T261_8234 [Streptomyces lydicus]